MSYYMGDNTEIQAELLNKEYGETLGYLLQRNCAENINGDLPSTTTKQVEHRKPQQQNRRQYGYY